MWPQCVLLFLLINCIKASNLSLVPNQIYAVVGSSLDATCSMSPQYAIATGFNSTRLSCLLRYEHDKELPLLVEIVNNTSIRLKYNLPEFIRDCSFICYVTYGGRRFEMIERVIYLEDVVSPPKIVEYYVQNWEHFHVMWSLNTSGRVYVSLQYSAWFKNSDERSNYTRCHALGPINVCSVEDVLRKVALDGALHIRVDVYNALGNNASTELLLQLNDIVKPNKVSHLHCDPVFHRNNNTLGRSVAFNSPKSGKILRYLVVLSCNGISNISSQIIGPTDNYRIQNVEISYVPAYSNCSITVTAKPSLGFWGFESKENFNTKELVPLALPEVCKSCFEFRPRNNSNLIDVIFYFKPVSLEMARGLITEYRLTCINQSHSFKRIFAVDQNRYSWLNVSGLQSNVEYDLSLRAGNHAGYNDSLPDNPVCIAKKSGIGRIVNGPVVSLLSKTEVKFQWGAVLDAVYYTLFWCQRVSALAQECIDVIQWKRMSENILQYTISLPSPLSATSYLFGTSVETKSGWNSGIIWSRCVYDATAAFAEPPTVMQSSNIDSSQITLKLIQPVCSDVVHGVIKAFNVYYCQYSSDHHCYGVTRQLKVDATGFIERSVKNVTLSGLSAGQTYLVLVETVTTVGTKSSHNSSIVITMRRHNGNDQNIVIVLVVIIGILVAIILVGLVHSACRSIRRKNARQSTPSQDYLMPSSHQRQQDSGGYRNIVVNSESTTTSLSAPLMRISARQSNKMIHLACEQDKALVTESDAYPNSDVSSGDGHASHQLKPHQDLEHRILPWISDADEQPLSMPSADASTFLPSNVLSDSHPLTRDLPAVHAASYPMALESIQDAEHSTFDTVDFRDTVRTSRYSEDLSYSQCSRQSL